MIKNIFSAISTNQVKQRQPVTIGGIKLTDSQELVHFLVTGTTGVGKTTGIVEMLQTISSRDDKIIIADPNGYYASRFASEQDVILNVFDRRSPAWSPFNEIRKTYDFDKIAKSIVPEGCGENASWHFYAQVLIADVMRSLMTQGKGNTQELIHALTVMPVQELKSLVAGSSAVGLFDENSARALASTRFILAAYLKPFGYLKEGNFSLRAFLESKRQCIFLTWREDMTVSLAPLIACWIDVICNAILSMPTEPKVCKRTWLVLDELATLGKISSLEAVLTKGRKHNLCCIAGLQSIAQVDRVYGRESSIILRSCFRNLVAFAIAKADPDTSEAISRALGEREVDRTVETSGRSSQGSSTSVSVQRVQERLVLPSELNELPNLTAYLALSGSEPTRKIRLKPQNLPAIFPAFVE